jgi:presenilin-like A22 family membrane protease
VNTKSLIRWLVIGGFAAYGVYGLVEGIRHLVRQHDAHWAVRCLFLAPVVVGVSGVFLAISYFTFGRQYRRLCTLIAAVLAVAVFGCIISVPEWLGITDWADSRAQGALPVFGGLLSIVALIAAWHGSRWVYRRANTFLHRYVQHQSHKADS